MPSRSTKKTTIGVTAFKSKCLGLINDVAQGRTDRVVLLKHNSPVAAIVPIVEDTSDKSDLWGAMRGTVTIAPGVDLTEAAGEIWNAEH